MLHSRCPVSATPTHMLRICVNPRHSFICGRADNACTNLLGFLVRYVRTRGSMRLRRIQNYRLYCMPFAALLVTQKREKEHPFYDFSQKIPHKQKNTPFPHLGKARHNACLSRDMLKLNLHLTLGTQYRMSGCRPPVIFLLLTRL